MKLNNIGYLLKEGFRSIFQHGFMSFAAICVTVACLIIVGSFSAREDCSRGEGAWPITWTSWCRT